jgi:hypothetical protein
LFKYPHGLEPRAAVNIARARCSSVPSGAAGESPEARKRSAMLLPRVSERVGLAQCGFPAVARVPGFPPI